MEWYYWVILFFVLLGIYRYYVNEKQEKQLMTELFESYGVNTSSEYGDAQSSTIVETSIALIRVNISPIEKAHETMESVVTNIINVGYDIETFLSNILLVPTQNEFQNLKKALGTQISDNSISIVTSEVKGYVGTYGNNNRQHFGHLSADIDKLLESSLAIDYGKTEHIA